MPKKNNSGEMRGKCPVCGGRLINLQVSGKKVTGYCLQDGNQIASNLRVTYLDAEGKEIKIPGKYNKIDN